MSLLTTQGSVHMLYEVDGHLYTTYAVAVLAGQPVASALELAWGSQIPDANSRYTAVRAAWRALWSDHHRSLMTTLHSLHGGDHEAVRRRREDLATLVAEAVRGGDPMWRAGLMIHAFGDSYAHTHGIGTEEEAYGVPSGHVHDGHTPDKIGNFPDKYLDYIAQLYRALGGTDDPQRALEPLHRIVRDNADDHEALSDGVIELAGTLGMERAASREVRERLLDEISVADVTETMELMERRFHG